MEILLIHPGGLGDIILSLPAIAALRESFRAARLTLAANIDHVAPIVGSYVESAVSFSSIPLHDLYTDVPLPPQDLRFWRAFDLVISWTGLGDGDFVRNLKKIHPGARIGRWRPLPNEPKHVSQLFLDSLGLQVPPESKAHPAPITLGPELSGQGLAWLSGRQWNERDSLVAIHAGAGSNAKRWPLVRFIDLARQLIFQCHRKLVIIEGPAESGLATQIARELPESEVFVAESLSLDLLGAIMSRSGQFVGNDSGIAHLAGALQIPSIVLFGPTLPEHWAPLGAHITVLRDPQGLLENIPVEQVIRLIPPTR